MNHDTEVFDHLYRFEGPLILETYVPEPPLAKLRKEKFLEIYNDTACLGHCMARPVRASLVGNSVNSRPTSQDNYHGGELDPS